MGGKALAQKLKEFKTRLSKDVSVEKIILFGSRARGKAKRESDVDLIVVSKNFKGKKSYERAVGFYRHWNLDYPVDFLCYTPEEFKKLSKMITIVRQAVREGVEI
ncbi:nucleotidyltransferase domain-containing protein [Candidatus Woesearchaeota archaeon]|nr:nucleotidyltransferase domain-containing protein [Candidatus Woesearchaeota archaeon]